MHPQTNLQKLEANSISFLWHQPHILPNVVCMARLGDQTQYESNGTPPRSSTPDEENDVILRSSFINFLNGKRRTAGFFFKFSNPLSTGEPLSSKLVDEPGSLRTANSNSSSSSQFLPPSLLLTPSDAEPVDTFSRKR
uniref:Uncharacterized protein n=1 Tax=Cucumis melo TaxID=3656 RepID=A0A9I9E7H0_CUCME